MSDDLFEADDANTPLTPSERDGLIPTYITTRAELNEAEQENINDADLWAFGRRRGDILEVQTLMALHRWMLRRVWRWAGAIRTSERNIGIAPHRIETELHQLVGDIRYWVKHHTYPPDEIAIRSIIDSWPSTPSPKATAATPDWPPTSSPCGLGGQGSPGEARTSSLPPKCAEPMSPPCKPWTATKSRPCWSSPAAERPTGGAPRHVGCRKPMTAVSVARPGPPLQRVSAAIWRTAAS